MRYDMPFSTNSLVERAGLWRDGYTASKEDGHNENIIRV
jgi:hypothetical protein